MKLNLSAGYWQTARVPHMQENGELGELVFLAQFKRAPLSEIKTLREELRTGELTDSDFLAKVLLRATELPEDGQPPNYDVPLLTAEARAELLEVYPVQPYLVDLWFESLEVQRTKNLPKPPDA